MNQPINHLGQPIGFPVADWSPRARPPRAPIEGHYCRLEPLDGARHGADLYRANQEDREGRIWTYMPYGPFETLGAYRDWIEAACRGDDPLYHAIVDLQSAKAVGVATTIPTTIPTTMATNMFQPSPMAPHAASPATAPAVETASRSPTTK